MRRMFIYVSREHNKNLKISKCKLLLGRGYYCIQRSVKWARCVAHCKQHSCKLVYPMMRTNMFCFHPCRRSRPTNTCSYRQVWIELIRHKTSRRVCSLSVVGRSSLQWQGFTSQHRLEGLVIFLYLQEILWEWLVSFWAVRLPLFLAS